MTSELRRILGFIYVHPIVFWGTCKAQGVDLQVIKRTRAVEIRQGRLRWCDEAIARFLDRYLYCHFFEVFMVPRPLAPAHAQTLFSPVCSSCFFFS